MSPAFLLAALCCQLPTPQTPLTGMAAPPAAPGPPQTFLLLTQAAPAVPTAPSVLVAHPPIWDRALAHTGAWLTARAARHQHPTALQAVTITPAVATVSQPAVVAAARPVMALPSPSAQSEAAPPAPFAPVSSPVLLVPDSSKAAAVKRLFSFP